MTVSPLQGITHACFGLSYLLALGFESARMAWPAVGWRIAALVAGAAGLFAHTVFIAYHQPTLAAPYGSLLVLAWVLALFYYYGTIHHARQAWAVFVLPLVIVLVGLSLLLATNASESPMDVPAWLSGDRFWGIVHGTLILLASVGVSVGFLASVMYLFQARRLKQKLNPTQGVPLLSLERLEAMNRRAVNFAFPLLTAGLLVGLLLLKVEKDAAENWLSIKVLSTAGLWVVFLVLLYLRYGTSVPARRLATLSIVSFGLLLIALVASHPFVAGEAR
jgi:ABC-type uncharacterized transport system permease subunit